mmetsp:Transcript_14480/g.42949  ORF Transcript_14480/g.42949 Transcript_14480/m.42949 type:complete len:257 (-) Transcript_14480:16-786(-)
MTPRSGYTLCSAQIEPAAMEWSPPHVSAKRPAAAEARTDSYTRRTPAPMRGALTTSSFGGGSASSSSASSGFWWDTVRRSVPGAMPLRLRTHVEKLSCMPESPTHSRYSSTGWWCGADTSKPSRSNSAAKSRSPASSHDQPSISASGCRPASRSAVGPRSAPSRFCPSQKGAPMNRMVRMERSADSDPLKAVLGLRPTGERSRPSARAAPLVSIVAAAMSEVCSTVSSGVFRARALMRRVSSSSSATSRCPLTDMF